MKRLLIILKLIFLIMINFCAISESYVDPSMAMTQRISALQKTEKLKPVYDSDKKLLNIYSEDMEGVKLYFSVKTRWGNWQISENKKRMLILINNENNTNYDLAYLLDGESGLLKYLRTIPIGCRSNSDITYILYEKDFFNRIFGLIDIQENAEILSFSWKLKEFDKVSDKAGFCLYRNTKLKNCFVVSLVVEAFTVAQGTYTIGEKEIRTEFDDTDKRDTQWKYSDDVSKFDKGLGNID